MSTGNQPKVVAQPISADRKHRLEQPALPTAKKQKLEHTPENKAPPLTGTMQPLVEIKVEEGDKEQKRAEAIKNMEVIEKEFTNLKEKYFAENMADLNKELEELQNGQFEGYVLSVNELTAAHKERLELADKWKEHKMNCIEQVAVTERKSAMDDLENQKKEIQTAMIKDVHRRVKKLEEEKDTMNITNDGPGSDTKRTLRKRGKDTRPKSHDKNKLVETFVVELASKEIQADMKDIASRMAAIISKK
mmetsp:Transcript_25521/g.28385  ORF Transcript_25521/g.28385 Transcript_25521/m.28385 type:complete len:248 (+) Transcript_25521:41-784(+)